MRKAEQEFPHFFECLASGRARERNQKIAELMEVFSKFAHIGGR